MLIFAAQRHGSETDNANAYIEYVDRFSLSFSIFSTTRKFTEIDREDDSYGALLSGELPFDDKNGLTGFFRYTNFDRKGIDPEKYDRYGLQIAYYYETRLGRVSSGYIHNRNDSNVSSGDYTNNIIYISASLKF